MFKDKVQGYDLATYKVIWLVAQNLMIKLDNAPPLLS